MINNSIEKKTNRYHAVYSIETFIIQTDWIEFYYKSLCGNLINNFEDFVEEGGGVNYGNGVAALRNILEGGGKSEYTSNLMFKIWNSV